MEMRICCRAIGSCFSDTHPERVTGLTSMCMTQYSKLGTESATFASNENKVECGLVKPKTVSFRSSAVDLHCSFNLVT